MFRALIVRGLHAHVVPVSWLSSPISRNNKTGPFGPVLYKEILVPKGRFELPRGYPHYALNVARLPFRHFGMKCCGDLEPNAGLEPATCCLRNSCSTN